MSTKPPARLTFLLDPELKEQFERVCAAEDITPSQMMRQMIKLHIAQHNAAKAPGAQKVGRAAR